MGVKIRERKPGKWWIYVDHNGQRKAKKVGSKKAALKVQQQLEARLTLGDFGFLKYKPKAEPTLSEYRKVWQQQAHAHCKSSTFESYVNYQDRYVLPRVGDRPIGSITKADILGMIGELKVALSKNTVRLAVASLRVLLSLAVEE